MGVYLCLPRTNARWARGWCTDTETNSLDRSIDQSETRARKPARVSGAATAAATDTPKNPSVHSFFGLLYSSSFWFDPSVRPTTTTTAMQKRSAGKPHKKRRAVRRQASRTMRVSTVEKIENIQLYGGGCGGGVRQRSIIRYSDGGVPTTTSATNWAGLFNCKSVAVVNTERTKTVKTVVCGDYTLKMISGVIAVEDGVASVVTWLNAGGRSMRSLWGPRTSLAFASVQLQDLDLSNNRLTRLPKHLILLTALSRLAVGGNQLRTLPNAMWRLTSLQSLLLDQNPLGGVIPPCVYRMTALQYLSVRNAQVTVIRPSIRRLQELRTVRLAGNLLRSVPRELCCLPNLQRLNLADNHRMTSVPDEVWMHLTMSTLIVPMEWLEIVFPASILSDDTSGATTTPLMQGEIRFATPQGEVQWQGPSPIYRWTTDRTMPRLGIPLPKRVCLDPSTLIVILRVPTLYQLCQACVHVMATTTMTL